MRAREIMTDRPAVVTAEDTVSLAAKLMEDHDCGCIPVVQGRNDGHVIGVITDRDIAVRGVAHGRSGDTAVRELMTPTPVCCSGEAELSEVEHTMGDRQIRRVVVVDDGGCCLGIIAQADLARAAEHHSEVKDEEVGRVVEKISEPSRGKSWRL